MSQDHPVMKEARLKSASGFALICLGMFLLVVALTVTCSYIFYVPHQEHRELVAEFSGQDDGMTGPFVVNDLWEFRWEHDGRIKRITWFRDDGLKDIFMEMPGKPVRYQGGINYEEGGEYRIQVEGTGNWTIKVYQF